MSKKSKIIIFSLCGIGIVAIIFAIISLKNQLGNQKEVVTSLPAYVVREQEPLVLDGSVMTKDEESYYFDATKGEISEVFVSDGQTVAVGDKLFSYYNEQVEQEISDLNRQKKRLYGQIDDLKQQLTKQEESKQKALLEVEQAKNKAQLAMQNAQKVGENTEEEKQQEAIPEFDPSTFDEAMTATKKAMKEVNQSIEDLEISIKRMSEKTSSIITATTDGLISVNQKGRNNPSEVFMKVIGSDSVIQTMVSEYDYYSVIEGLETDIYVNAQARDLTGTITFVAKEPVGFTANTMGGKGSSELSKYQVLIKPMESIPVGFNVQVKVPLKGLVIPEKAIITNENEEYVYKVEQNKVVKTKIVRQKEGLQLIVTEGITLGDTILSQPDDTITDGQSVVVEIINKDVESND